MSLFYHLDSTPAPDSGACILHVKTSGKPVLTTQDREALDWVRKCKTVGSDSYHLPAGNLEKGLKLLAATGKLYFAEKRLTCDFFSKGLFSYQIEKVSEGKFQVSGSITDNGKDIPLKSCDAIRAGSPPCYIRQGILRFLSPDLLWKHLKGLYEVEKLAIDAYWKEVLLSDDMPVVYLNCSREEFIGKKDPLPILTLKDRSGAFASLYIDHGEGKEVLFNRLYAESAEKLWEKDLLETDFYFKPAGTSMYYCPMDKVAKSLTFLLELGWQVRDHQGKRIELMSHKHLEVENKGPRLLVKGSLEYASHSVEIKDVVGCFNKREKFINLSEDSVGLLPEQEMLGDLEALALNGEIVAEGISIPKMRLGLLEPLSTTSEWNPLKEISPEPLPAIFQGKLRPYQKEGVDWLVSLFHSDLHALLADDMGLGKTVQVLAFLATIQKKALIIVPTSLIHNWKAEIQKFLPTWKVHVYHGQDRSIEESADITLTTFATVRIDQTILSGYVFDCLIVDESHYIKNPLSQTAQAIYMLKAGFRLSMTGTPIENNLKELWSQFHFLLPGLLGSLDSFVNDVEASSSDMRFLQRIKRQVRPFILRRKKKDVAPELPEKIEQTVWIEMTPSQRDLYENFLANARSNLFSKVGLDGVKKHRLEILEVLLRLRQICCHPLLVAAQSEEIEKLESAKIDLVLNDLTTLAEEGSKVLIYSQFTSLLKLVAKELNNQGHRFCYLDGQTTHRQQVVDQFQQDAQLPFFLISLKAGGVGLNLTAADYVLLLDPWWNEAAEQQAIDRAHRIGRQEPVIAKRYVTIDSIEEKMQKLKLRKKNLAEDIIDDEMVISSLDEEDLLSLLND